MKLYVISDIHGAYEDLEMFINKLVNKEYDNLIILGDILHGYGYSNNTQISQIGNLLSKVVTKLILIKGNCDLEEDVKYLPIGFKDNIHLMLRGRNIYFVHGHHYFPFSLLNEKDILCHGHTHINHITINKEKKFIECCPGSISMPRANTPKTYMEINDHKIIIYDMNDTIIKEIEL